MTEIETEMRLEKKQFIGKRNAYKEAAPFIDELLLFKDKMREVADDSGLRLNYLMQEVLGILGFFEDDYDTEDEAEEE